MTDAKAPEYASGYRCPACNFESVGVELSGEGFDRRHAGWTFRVAVDTDLRIACSQCGADVPRESWTFSNSQGPAS